MIDRNQKRQIKREKLLFRYHNALERGDFETLSAVLEEAQHDPILERMILEVHEVYLTDLQSGQPFRPLDHRSNFMNISMPNARHSRNLSVTLTVAAVIALAFSFVLIYNAYRNSPFNFAGLFQSQEETNTATFLRYTEEAWNQGNVDMLAEVLTDDHIRHDNGVDYTGIDAVAELVTAFRTAMPDLHFEIRDITADGDTVWAYVIGSGTQTGPLVLPDGTTILPSGAPVTLRAMAIGRFMDGKITEIWVEYDNLSYMEQIGAVPSVQEEATEHANIELVQRLFDEWWYGGNHDIVLEVYPTNGALSHWPYIEASMMSPISWRNIYDYYIDVFPDYRWTVDNIIAQGDFVMVHTSFRGTQERDVQTINGSVIHPPEGGGEVTWDGVYIFRIEAGKIAEEWWYWDNELFAQGHY